MVTGRANEQIDLTWSGWCGTSEDMMQALHAIKMVSAASEETIEALCQHSKRSAVELANLLRLLEPDNFFG